MGTRVVSFLGLGPGSEPPFYFPVRYRWEAVREQPSSETPLVQAALLELLPGASLYLLGTKEVEARWLAPGGEGAELDKCVAPAGRYFKRIPAGAVERERWDIFKAIQQALKPEKLEELGETEPPERIVVDITHGFRIQPILGLAAVAFAQSDWVREERSNPPQLRVVYGAFEASVPTADGGEEEAPIWDLTDFLNVARWNGAFDAFFRYGRADDIAALAKNEAGQAMDRADSQGVAKADQGDLRHIGNLGGAIQQLADDLATGRNFSVLTQTSKRVLGFLDNPATKLWIRRLPVLQSALDQLRGIVQPLSADSPLDGAGMKAIVALTKFYLRIQRFSELSATLREALITHFAWANIGVYLGPLRSTTDGDGFNFERRRKLAERRWSEAVHLGFGQSKEDGGADPFANDPNISFSRDLIQVRNDVQHAGYRNRPLDAASIRAKLSTAADKLDRIITGTPDKPVVFVNFTNHPVRTWSKAQKVTARQLRRGQPTDLRDPGILLVPPNATSKHIEQLAERLIEQAKELGAIGGAAVQGEHGLALALVSRLQAMGVSCYMATTERDVTEDTTPEGASVSHHTFRFVRWRAYPRLVEP